MLLWYLLPETWQTIQFRSICSKSDNAKSIQNTLDAASWRIHGSQLAHLLIDRQADIFLPSILRISSRLREKTKLCDKPILFSKNLFKGTKCWPSRFPCPKDQKPAAGGAPIGKRSQNRMIHVVGRCIHHAANSQSDT